MAKKAVIQSGSRQYVVSQGDTLTVERIKGVGKTVSFEPLLIIDGETTKVGTPAVAGAKVTAEVVVPEMQGDKTTSIRYKAKKRVHTVRGHRQTLTELKITKIS